MTLDLSVADALADAVLMEGYALYPYRASAPKNRFRWTFGVLAPRAWSEAGGCEAWWLEAQLVVAGAPDRIAGRLRFFQISRQLDRHTTWDEGVLHALDFEVGRDGCVCDLSIPGDGKVRLPLAARIEVGRSAVHGGDGRPLELLKLRVENRTPWSELAAPRDRALAAALASTHLVLGVEGGELVSAIDPPPWAAALVAATTQTGTFPVLVGPPGARDVALCAPFVMYDHPTLAPESAGDMCDATEIDELLVLRARTMTDDEKRAARATDPRAAAIVDRADWLPDEMLARMHGASRALRPTGEMAPPQLAAGAKVRIKPPVRRTDAQDLLYAGRVATVAHLRHDVDGSTFVAVTIDDDPAAELHGWYGRFHHYRTDEVEPL